MKIKITFLAALLFASPLVYATGVSHSKVEIVITQSGRIEVQQKIVSKIELQEFLAHDQDAIVRILSDSKADSKILMSVLDACRQAGVTKIDISSLKRPNQSPDPTAPSRRGSA